MLVRPSENSGPVPLQLWLLVGSMALIELVLSGADSGWIGAADWRAIAFDYGAFWQPIARQDAAPLFAAQPYAMFLSYAFLHGGMFHFAMNGVILLALGKLISDLAGPWPMLMLFALSAVAGAVVFALIADTTEPMIGASGADFGFLGLWLYWEAMARRAHRLSQQPVLAMAAGLVVLNVVLAVALHGGLAWQTHLGGFAAGVALGPIMSRIARRRLSN